MVDLRLPIGSSSRDQLEIDNWQLAMDLVGEDRIESRLVGIPRSRMLALHHTPKENFELRSSDLKFDEVIVKARVKN